MNSFRLKVDSVAFFLVPGTRLFVHPQYSIVLIAPFMLEVRVCLAFYTDVAPV